jgi:hypothetical protein
MQFDRSPAYRKALSAAMLLALVGCATPNKEAGSTQTRAPNTPAETRADSATTPPGQSTASASSQKAGTSPSKIDSLAQLAEWEGKYPGVSGYPNNIWDIPLFQRIFEKTVGKKNANEIVHGWDGPSQSQLLRVEDSLALYVNKNHDGSAHNAYILISLKSNTLGVCLHQANAAKKTSSDVWMETGKPAKTLPAAACAKYEQLFKK